MENKEENQELIAPKKNNRFKLIVTALVVIAVLGIAGYKFIDSRQYETTDNAQIESSATPVLSRVAGYIANLDLKDYQSVTKGQLLLEIEDSEYKIAVQQAEADLATAKGDLNIALAQVNDISSDKIVAAAGVNVEDVNLEKAKIEMERDRALFNEGSITRRQLDNSTSSYKIALNQVQTSKSKVNQINTQFGRANAQIEKARANVAVKEAMLESAKLKLSFTKVYSPATGRIGRTNLQERQYVQAGQQLFNVVSSQHFWIVANFKETQIAKMSIGQQVEVELDGYSNRKILGKIAEFSIATGSKFTLLPADNATGNFVKVTQRVPVKIEFSNEEEIKDILKSGLSVTIKVKVQ